MTEKERQALMSIILGEHPRCTYDTLIRLEHLGYIEFVMDDYELSYGAYNAYLPEGNFWNDVQQKPIRGNIYLAKVTRVEPSLQAAFVDARGLRRGPDEPAGEQVRQRRMPLPVRQHRHQQVRPAQQR